MVSLQVLGISAVCILAYISCVQAECKMTSRGKMDVCVATFSTANLFNLEDRKALISVKNTTCPVNIMKNSCTSFNIMMNCVNVAGFPEGCEDEFNKELKNQQFECTYEELAKVCPDAEKLGGAGSIMVSLSLIAVSLAVAIFGRQ